MQLKPKVLRLQYLILVGFLGKCLFPGFLLVEILFDNFGAVDFAFANPRAEAKHVFFPGLS